MHACRSTLEDPTGGRIVELLEELNRESGSTVVIVTHDLALAQRAHRMIRLRDGVVVEDTGAPTVAIPVAARLAATPTG